MIKRLLNPSSNPAYLDLALLFLRVTIGCFMLFHGMPKMSQLMAGNFQFADPLGMGEKTSLILTVLNEFVFSILLIFGFGTRLIVIGMIITMSTIVFIVHGSDGFEIKEKALLYLVPYVFLLIAGGGKYSLDYFIHKKL